MRVLVACEESQAVCMAFRERGHEAYSCDLQHCALYNHIEWHIVENALDVIRTPCSFITVDGRPHTVEAWDLLIAHPPCTYLTRAGATLLFNKDHTIKNPARYSAGLKARELFMNFMGADVPRVAVENPVPLSCWGLPPFTQIVEPYQYGEPYLKKTCLWLRGLPPLRPTNIVKPNGFWCDSQRPERARQLGYHLKGNRDPKMRSKTFPGIARAMAEQWGQ